MSNLNCNVEYSEDCSMCVQKLCGASPIIEHILLSNEVRKISNLNKLLSKYHLKVSDYINPRAKRNN